jgi:nucleotide-binding universal stress UspA family protein
MYERVLVTLDGSDVAEAILPFVEKMAGPMDAEVVLVRVVDPLSPAETIAAAGVVAPDSLMLRRIEAKEYLCTIRDRLAAKGIRVRTGLRSGEPAPEIVAAAATWGVDLIAMATHGRSGLGRALFGSVAETVLRTAPVPVLMMRTTEKAAAAETRAR